MAIPDGLLVARTSLADLVEERAMAESTTDTAPYAWLMSLSFPQSVLAGANAASTNGVAAIRPRSPSPSRPYARGILTLHARCSQLLVAATCSP
jgi:hypothetical protein